MARPRSIICATQRSTWIVGLATLLGWTTGCQVVALVPLAGESGKFEVEPGAATQNLVAVETQFNAGSSGSFSIDPSAVTVTLASGESGGDLEMARSTLFVTLRVDDLENLENACESEDEYGPYAVTLDQSLVPQSVDPLQIPFSGNTLQLIEAGQWSLCVEVSSSASLSLEVHINGIFANLGI